MIKLQNNFTTPEQSKQLIKLGVPADSADCYNTITHIGKIPEDATYKEVWQMSKWRDENGNHIEMYPSWSVGRLQEIIRICLGENEISICVRSNMVEGWCITYSKLYNTFNVNYIYDADGWFKGILFKEGEHAEQAIKMLGDELKYLFEPW